MSSIWKKIDEFGQSLNMKTRDMERDVNTRWDDFPIQCPECFQVSQPPSSSGSMPVFECTGCGILLKTPTNIEKTFFLFEQKTESFSHKVNWFVGGKNYFLVPTKVPAGLQGGDEMSIECAGKQYNFVVPTGLKPGDKFRIQVDVTAESVIPVRPYLAQIAEIGKAKSLQPGASVVNSEQVHNMSPEHNLQVV